MTRPNLALVPPEYHRRQTLVNAERFITGPLKEMEEQITGAREQLVRREYELFEALREEVAAAVPPAAGRGRAAGSPGLSAELRRGGGALPLLPAPLLTRGADPDQTRPPPGG